MEYLHYDRDYLIAILERATRISYTNEARFSLSFLEFHFADSKQAYVAIHYFLYVLQKRDFKIEFAHKEQNYYYIRFFVPNIATDFTIIAELDPVVMNGFDGTTMKDEQEISLEFLYYEAGEKKRAVGESNMYQKETEHRLFGHLHIEGNA